MKLTWLLTCLTLMLCACPKPVSFSTDPSIMRGAWAGTISHSCQTNISDLAWSPDGTLIATVGSELVLWNATDGTRVRTITGLSLYDRHEYDRRELHWSADGKRLAVLRFTRPGVRVQVFDPSSGAIISARDFTPDFQTASLSDDLETLIGVINATANGQIRPQSSPPVPLQPVKIVLWNASTGLEKRSIALGAVWVDDLVVNADATRFAVGINNERIQIFEATDTPRELVVGPNEEISKLFWSAAGTRLSASLTSKFRTWNAADGAVVRDLEIGTNYYGSASIISPDEKRLTVVRYPNTLELWNLSTSAKISSTTLTRPYAGDLGALRFNPASSQWGFTEQNACDLRVLNASDGSSLRNIAVDQAESKTITLALQAQFQDGESYTITGTANVQGEPAYTVKGVGFIGVDKILEQAVPPGGQRAQLGLRDPSGNVIWGKEPVRDGPNYTNLGQELGYSSLRYFGEWLATDGRRFQVNVQPKP